MKSSFLYSFKKYRRFLLSGLIITSMSWFCLAGWDLVTPSPTGKSLWGVYFIDSLNGWIVGDTMINISTDNSAILHTTNGGLIWDEQLSKENSVLRNLFIFDKEYGWVTGGEKGNGIILKTNNGGLIWETQKSDTVGFLKPFFIDINNGWCLGFDLHGYSLIYRTEDGGKDWNLVFSTDTYELKDMFFTDSSNGWTCGENRSNEGIILYSNDAGKSWTLQLKCDYEVYGYGLKSTYFFDPKRGWAVGDGGMIWHTSDGGENWKEQVQGWPTIQYLSDVHFTDKMTGWSVGDKGYITRTGDAGKTWKMIDFVDTNVVLYDIHFTDHYHGWIVGSNGTILRTTDGGGFPQPILYNPSISNHLISLQNYPNPFSKTTTITYTTKQPGTVTIEIFNLFGRKIRTLVNQYKNPGKHAIQWNGTNSQNLPVSKGVYYSVVTVDTGTEKIRQREKMVLQ